MQGAEAVKRRAADSAARHGGQWFAEEFIEGREFNIAVVDGKVMPMAEMVFENWPKDQPRIVGWRAKWHEESAESDNTVRYFGVEKDDPVLAAKLRHICETCWTLFGLKGYARVDFRGDRQGRALRAGDQHQSRHFARRGASAAAAQAGMNYERVHHAFWWTSRAPAHDC